MANPFVAVMMGSDSDLGTMQAAFDILDKLGIAYEVKIASAHRTPEATHAYVKEADGRGCAVFIAAAGLANHLSGTVAAVYELVQRIRWQDVYYRHDIGYRAIARETA